MARRLLGILIVLALQLGRSSEVDRRADEEFGQWVTTTRSTGPTLDAETYAGLAKASEAVTPYTYRAIAPDLFNRLVMSAFRSDEISQFVCSQSQRVDK
jgi:cytochrome o ubiquinol oxidase subunit 2